MKIKRRTKRLIAFSILEIVVALNLFKVYAHEDDAISKENAQVDVVYAEGNVQTDTIEVIEEAVPQEETARHIEDEEIVNAEEGAEAPEEEIVVEAAEETIVEEAAESTNSSEIIDQNLTDDLYSVIDNYGIIADEIVAENDIETNVATDKFVAKNAGGAIVGASKNFDEGDLTQSSYIGDYEANTEQLHLKDNTGEIVFGENIELKENESNSNEVQMIVHDDEGNIKGEYKIDKGNSDLDVNLTNGYVDVDEKLELVANIASSFMEQSKDITTETVEAEEKWVQVLKNDLYDENGTLIAEAGTEFDWIFVRDKLNNDWSKVNWNNIENTPIQISTVEKQSNDVIINKKDTNNTVIDTSNCDLTVSYINITTDDYSKIPAGGMNVIKQEDQIIIFNFVVDDEPSIDIQEFYVQLSDNPNFNKNNGAADPNNKNNGIKTGDAVNAQGNDPNKSLLSQAQKIVFNFGDYTGTIKTAGSIVGTIIAPFAKIVNASTSAGNLIAKEVEITNGEWHSVSYKGQPTPKRTPDKTSEPTPTEVPTPDKTPEPTPTEVPTETPIPTETPTPVPTETPRPTETPVPTETPTPVPTSTPVPTETPRPTETPVPTSTPKPTETPVPTETPKPTNTPEPTSTPTPELTPTPTSTPEVTPTKTPEVTATPTSTPEVSPTPTPEQTATPVPTSTPEITATPEITPTSTPVVEFTPTPTPEETPSPTPDEVPTPEPTPEETPYIEETPEPTPYIAPTPENSSQVLGARRVPSGSSILGARRAMDQAVLGKRRSPNTGDNTFIYMVLLSLSCVAELSLAIYIGYVLKKKI